MEEQSYLTFPQGALADQPVRIPVLWDSGDALALAKPAGIPAFQDTRMGGGPRSLLVEINNRAAAGATEFDERGGRGLYSVNLLEREASGIVLYAKTAEARAALKNAMGSSRFVFRYRFLSAANPAADDVSCDLPVAIHREKPLALVSHRTGKKTQTLFRCLQRFAGVSLWESESAYDRFHQIRLHAAEAGLPVLGDGIYREGRRALEAAPAAAEKKGLPEDGLFLHLFGLRFPVGESWVEVEAPYPRRWQVLLKKLER
jgi:23S rRNA pseudouridine955/2504/2580 synthase